MAHSIGMTGMDPQTGAALDQALEQANRELGGAWRVVGDQDADVVFVDMDSMYGPMSWIRLHANGKRVIGVTAASRTQADFHLARPFDAASVLALLQSIAQVPVVAPAEPSVVVPASATPAPAPSDQLREEAVTPRDEELSPAMVEPIIAIPTSAPSPPEPAPPPALPEPALPEHDPLFLDWLAPGALSGYFRYRRGDGPVLLIDADARQYHGPAALKPLADAISGSVRKEAFVEVPAIEWSAAAQAAGDARPLTRLQWFAGLVAGHGALLPGLDPQGKYRLGKWPQTEREFPKHFRIATVMMKAPASIEEIAAGSGVGLEEVADFVNASLATGYAEAWREPEPEPEPQKPGGLFGRLRGR